MPRRKTPVRDDDDDDERSRGFDETLKRARAEHHKTAELIADALRIQSDSSTIRERLLRARKDQKP